MEYEIMYQPSYSLLKVSLQRDEAISAESGAMVSMSSTIKIETHMKGGILGTLKRKVLGGESFFVNTFHAEEAGEITLAPSLPGDLHAINLEGQTIYAQSGAYIASSPGIEIDTTWGGAKTFLSREGFFLLKIMGTGAVFLSSYGAIHEVHLMDGQKYIVDTGHMVAFDHSVTYNVGKVGGLKSTLFSGEGLVCELTGPGKIMLQTRSEDAFLSWLIPQLPSKRND
jgi:uncharacterized protein (TIGR00266 family)